MFQCIIQFSSEAEDRIKFWNAWIFYYMILNKCTFSRLMVMPKLVCDFFFPVKIYHFGLGKNRKIPLYLCPVTVTREAEDRGLHISDCCFKRWSFGWGCAPTPPWALFAPRANSTIITDVNQRLMLRLVESSYAIISFITKSDTCRASSGSDTV